MVSDVASKGQTGFSLPVAVSDQVDMSQGRRYLKPGWFVSWMVNPLLMRLGAVPTLAVRGRTTGEWRTVPVNVLCGGRKPATSSRRSEARGAGLHRYSQPEDPGYLRAQQSFAATHAWFSVRKLDAHSHFPMLVRVPFGPPLPVSAAGRGGVVCDRERRGLQPASRRITGIVSGMVRPARTLTDASQVCRMIGVRR